MACTTHSDYFRIALNRLLGIEGGFVDDAQDPGGKTRFGITEATARRHGYEGPMSELPLDVTRQIYDAAYWEQVNGDSIAGIDPGLAFELFEASVHISAGVWRVGLWLQQLLNALNRHGELYADITEDGIIGPITIGALDEYYDARGEEGLDVLRALVNCLQGSYYVRETRADVSDEEYLYGWARKRILSDSRA